MLANNALEQLDVLDNMQTEYKKFNKSGDSPDIERGNGKVEGELYLVNNKILKEYEKRNNGGFNI